MKSRCIFSLFHLPVEHHHWISHRHVTSSLAQFLSSEVEKMIITSKESVFILRLIRLSWGAERSGSFWVNLGNERMNVWTFLCESSNIHQCFLSSGRHRTVKAVVARAHTHTHTHLVMDHSHTGTVFIMKYFSSGQTQCWWAGVKNRRRRSLVHLRLLTRFPLSFTLKGILLSQICPQSALTSSFL